MAVFSTVIRKQRNDGMYPVYICINHNSQPGYIKTSFAVSEKGLRITYTKTGREKQEVSDPHVLSQCYKMIEEYNTQINAIDVDCTIELYF